MQYHARAIANWFIDRAAADGRRLTAMQLQKLCYIAHGWNLGLGFGPFIHEPVEAWKFGPVFRSLYSEFADFGGEPITRKATAFDGSFTEVEREISLDDYELPEEERELEEEFLESIWDQYGTYTGTQLSALTHKKGTPWHQLYEKHNGRLPRYATISNDMIREHYSQLHDRRRQTSG